MKNEIKKEKRKRKTEWAWSLMNWTTVYMEVKKGLKGRGGAGEREGRSGWRWHREWSQETSVISPFDYWRYGLLSVLFPRWRSSRTCCDDFAFCTQSVRVPSATLHTRTPRATTTSPWTATSRDTTTCRRSADPPPPGEHLSDGHSSRATFPPSSLTDWLQACARIERANFLLFLDNQSCGPPTEQRWGVCPTEEPLLFSFFLLLLYSQLNTAPLWAEVVLVSPWQTCHPERGASSLWWGRLDCGDTSGASAAFISHRKSMSQDLKKQQLVFELN